MTTAVIFVPADHLADHADVCLDYCAAKGYEVEGLITGDWEAAATMLIDRIAGVLVVARLDHLDPNREPRVEVVAEHVASKPRNQRTRLIRRDEAE